MHLDPSRLARRHARRLAARLLAAFLVFGLGLGACGDSEPTPPASSGAAKDAAPAPAAGHGGPVIPLGEMDIGPFHVRVTRDDGPLTPGGDAPIDVTVRPAAGATDAVAAVRFWIGLEDGAASVKARAEVENAAEPDRWHTHAELPDPLPEGSRLWVEIESRSGARSVGSFDLAR